MFAEDEREARPPSRAPARAGAMTRDGGAPGDGSHDDGGNDGDNGDGNDDGNDDGNADGTFAEGGFGSHTHGQMESGEGDGQAHAGPSHLRRAPSTSSQTQKAPTRASHASTPIPASQVPAAESAPAPAYLSAHPSAPTSDPPGSSVPPGPPVSQTPASAIAIAAAIATPQPPQPPQLSQSPQPPQPSQPSQPPQPPQPPHPQPTPPRPATPHLDLATYPTPTLLRLLASLLQQIATANDQLRTDLDDEDMDAPAQGNTHDDAGSASEGQSSSHSRASSSFPTHPSPTTALFAFDHSDPASNMTGNTSGAGAGAGAGGGSGSGGSGNANANAAGVGMGNDGDYESHLFTASKAALNHQSALLAFHARHIPSISIEAYLLRILKYCPTTNEVFLGLLVYFDRMSRLGTPAGIGGTAAGVRKGFAIDSYNVHRLVIAGVTVASKFFSDVFYTNSRYAKVGGLPPSELNSLELQFLLLNDFRLVIPPDEMQRYGDRLLGYWEGKESELGVDAVVPPSQAPSIRPTEAVDGAAVSQPPLAPPHSTPHRQATTPAASMASSESMRRAQYPHPLPHPHPPQTALSAPPASQAQSHSATGHPQSHVSVTPRSRERDRSIAFDGASATMTGMRGWTGDEGVVVASPMRE